MANKILTSILWEQRIRDVIGVDEAYLPNSAIQQPEIINIAEANIIKMIPEYATLTGDDRIYLESAVVYECCILLCPSMPARLPSKEQNPNSSHELNVNWDNKKAEFEEKRNEYVYKISIVTYSTLLHFGLSQ